MSDDFDKDYSEPESPVLSSDNETGEEYYRHPFTNQKFYIEPSEEES